MKRIVSAFAVLALLASVISIFTSCESGYECDTCKDKLKITCRDCDGEKMTECVLCHGEGSVDCLQCHGTGRKTCIICSGMGRRYEMDYITGMYGYKTCYSCSGMGSTICALKTPCSCTNGKITCDKCDSNGEITCPDCFTH